MLTRVMNTLTKKKNSSSNLLTRNPWMKKNWKMNPRMRILQTMMNLLMTFRRKIRSYYNTRKLIAMNQIMKSRTKNHSRSNLFIKIMETTKKKLMKRKMLTTKVPTRLRVNIPRCIA